VDRQRVAASAAYGHRSHGLGDDCGISGIGFGFTRVQIGDQDAFVAGDCDRQRANGGGLIDDKQELAVCLEVGNEGAQFGLIVGQRLVVQALPGLIECYSMMLAFAYINADDDIDGVVLLVLLHRRLCGLSGLACRTGGKSRHPRYGRPQEHLGRVPISDHHAPTRPGDTPPDHGRLGQESCRAWLAKAPIVGA
jgi:hypothetical protein